MLRKLVHVIDGVGQGYHVPRRNRLVTQVGELYSVLVRLELGGRLQARVLALDGQWRREQIRDVPGEHHAYRSDLVQLTEGMHISYRDDGLGPEPFNEGLTPAVYVTGTDQPFRIIYAVHVRLL